MNKLEYKGYFGTIEFSLEDNCFFGKVIGMPHNHIGYEGNTAEELYQDFKDGIDSYLDYCHREGIKPRKSYNGMLNIRIPAKLHGTMAVYAETHGTSINAVIREKLEREFA
ncbi:MAG: type II toxin-antitoxin system HicB family antitoxin [Bacteroidales bacterium]|jgi:predicted HicB family RNase H-like nuclease|nr:type II toxin-antitoxin system HicB family antitoxin [Bacteroidales bacterium]